MISPSPTGDHSPCVGGFGSTGGFGGTVGISAAPNVTSMVAVESAVPVPSVATKVNVTVAPGIVGIAVVGAVCVIVTLPPVGVALESL